MMANIRFIIFIENTIIYIYNIIYTLKETFDWLQHRKECIMNFSMLFQQQLIDTKILMKIKINLTVLKTISEYIITYNSYSCFSQNNFIILIENLQIQILFFFLMRFIFIFVLYYYHCGISKKKKNI